jgi:hypothetical protein
MKIKTDAGLRNILCWRCGGREQYGSSLTIAKCHAGTDEYEVEDGEGCQGDDVPLMLLYCLMGFFGVLGDRVVRGVEHDGGCMKVGLSKLLLDVILLQ